MPEGEQFGFEGGAMANGVADGDEKSAEDGSHAAECAATINRRKRLDDLATDGVFGRDRWQDTSLTSRCVLTPVRGADNRLLRSPGGHFVGRVVRVRVEVAVCVGVLVGVRVSVAVAVDVSVCVGVKVEVGVRVVVGVSEGHASILIRALARRLS